MEVSIQFHLNAPSAPYVFRSFGEQYGESIVHPIVRAAVRDAASEFTAVALVDQRANLQERMERLVRVRLLEILNGRDIDETAIIIDNILLRNIDLPTSLDEAIANVQRQTQETAARRQALETARAESDRAFMQAQGDARALTTRATAEAEANRTISASLTPALLRMRAIEATQAITTNPNTRTVILGGGGSMPLILNMDSDSGPSPVETH
jgi:regulator of protease activity HflC (stomatin/prohibitin superfamily)